MKQFQKTNTAVGIAACALLTVSSLQAQTVEYQINVNTSSLVGNSDGPYYVDYQLNSGGGSYANTAIVNNFNFGAGGSPSAPGSAIAYVGTPTGDLSTGFTLNDNPTTSPFNEIAQQFNPGQTLSFDVTLTKNGGYQTPDEFEFAIDDGSTYQIPTTALDGISLATIDINRVFSNPVFTVSSYPAAGAEYAGLTANVAAVPEPSTESFLALSLGLAGLLAATKLVKKTA